MSCHPGEAANLGCQGGKQVILWQNAHCEARLVVHVRGKRCGFCQQHYSKDVVSGDFVSSRPDGKEDGSTANVVKFAKSSGWVISMNSLGQTVVDLGGARRTWARRTLHGLEKGWGPDPLAKVKEPPTSTWCLAGRIHTSFVSMKGVCASNLTSRFSTTRPSNVRL